MNTIADTRIIGENITYSFPQDLLSPTVDLQIGIELPSILPFEDLFEKKTAEPVVPIKPLVLSEEEILKLAKKYYEENKKSLLKKYKGRYIAIFNNKVIDADKDFSKLAERVYKKCGYRTIYMPFIEEEERIIRIPSPRIKNP